MPKHKKCTKCNTYKTACGECRPKEKVKYPEHEKLDTDKLKLLDEFVEWLAEQGFTITHQLSDTHQLSEGTANWVKLRAKFFGTTEEALEKEREHMLEDLQNQF